MENAMRLGTRCILRALGARALGVCLGAFLAPACSSTPAVGNDGGVTSDGGVASDGGARADGGAADGGFVVQVPTCPSGGSINGTAVDSYHSPFADGGTSAQPHPFEPAAFVLSDGGFCVSRGTMTDGGAFTIPNVPTGPYYLRTGATSYVVTSSRTPDVGTDRLGRPNAVPATMPTRVVLNVTAMTPWDYGDELQLVAANANTVLFWLEANFATQLAVNETALVGEFDYPQSFANLIEGSSGDEAVIVQLVAGTAGTVPYRAAAKVFRPASFTMHDGATTTLTGAFTDNAASDTISLQWQRSQFAALAAQINPSATVSIHNLYVDPMPGGMGCCSYAGTPDLLVVDQAEGNADLTLSNVAFKNPFPPHWGIVVLAGTLFQVPYTLPGATGSPAREYGGVTTIQLRAAATAGPLRPLVEPVRAPLVNGSSAFTPATGIGLTPTVSWTAPATGTPTWYNVSIRRLFIGSTGRAQRETVADVQTTSTSVVLPPNLLLPGETYYFKIGGGFEGSIDFNEHPHRLAFPSASASVATATFTP
jgi:hypothetical protein